MTTGNHTPKIVARIDHRYVCIYLCLNGEYKWNADDCRIITAHEMTKADTVWMNKDNAGRIEITRGINNILIANYYVDEIQVLCAGNWNIITAPNQPYYDGCLRNSKKVN